MDAQPGSATSAAQPDRQPHRGGGLLLALDAGSPLVSAALGHGGEVVGEHAAPIARSSTQVLALVAAALAAASARPADFAGVVALAGPGSFTGLRVGLATALALHQALGIRAQAVPTLQAMAAASAAPPGSRVIAAVDALRGEWSAQAFRAASAGQPPQPLGEMALVPGAELLARLATGSRAGPAITGQPAGDLAAEPEPVVVIAFDVGSIAALHGDPVAGGRPVRYVEAPPLAAAALRLAAAIPEAEWRAASLAAPIYSRPPATSSPKARGAQPLGQELPDPRPRGADRR
jgi:tRNA threonylcarbamoyladenosine biosynthesis protein TsaB